MTVCKVAVLRKLDLKVARGEVVVRLPTFRVPVWRTKMTRLQMENSKALMPAGPKGIHDQNRSFFGPSKKAFPRPMRSEGTAA